MNAIFKRLHGLPKFKFVKEAIVNSLIPAPVESEIDHPGNGTRCSAPVTFFLSALPQITHWQTRSSLVGYANSGDFDAAANKRGAGVHVAQVGATKYDNSILRIIVGGHGGHRSYKVEKGMLLAWF
jgi:hypothetical protein